MTTPEPRYYRKTNGFPVDQYLTAAAARALYEKARLRPDADLDGGMSAGFHYFNGESSLRVRVHVMPAPEAQIPTRFLDMLKSGADSAP